MNLHRRSIEVIRQNQAGSGAYVASPNFPSYGYCWLRDGSFIAHAMDCVGEHGSARAFLRWVDRTIRRHAWKVERVLDRLEKGHPPDGGDYLHTRYTMDGDEATSEWWNFQLDGYGTWLWALSQHVSIIGDTALLTEVAESIQATVRYLSASWTLPNYDCWEEHPQYLHPYTLSAIYAGLEAANSMGPASDATVTDQIRRFVLERGVQDGHLVKSIRPGGASAAANPEWAAAVDANLIGVTTPYRLLAPDEPLAQATVARIETDLHCPGGGVRRYLADTYYGGGEWVLLAAWLGWHYAEVGQWEQARELLHWVEAQADGDGCLPEQVSVHLLAPDRHAEWEARWGPVAKPLLWSHAMYLILQRALEAARQG